MVLVVILVEGLVNQRLTVAHRRPPTDDEFLQAVRYQDEHLVKYWADLVSDTALCSACKLVCQRDSVITVRSIYTEMAVRIQNQPKVGNLSPVLCRSYVGKHACKAARQGYRATAAVILDVMPDLTGYLIGCALVEGRLEMFDDLLPRAGLGHVHAWLNTAVAWSRSNMYERLTLLLIEQDGAEGVREYVRSIYHAHDYRNYALWLRTQPKLCRLLGMT